MPAYVLTGKPPGFNPAIALSDEEVAADAAELLRLIPNRSSGVGYMCNELRFRLAHEFGRRQGWTMRDDPYAAQHFQGKRPQYHQRDNPPWLDHAMGYRIGRTPMATVSQPYRQDRAQVVAMQRWAEDRGLVFTIPDYPSWWYPGWTLLCVFSREPLK